MLIIPVYSQSLKDVSVSLASGPYLYADDGNCGGSEVPLAAYIVLNLSSSSSTDTLLNIKVKLDSISNDSMGFKLLSDQSDSIYTVARLLPLDSSGAYFFVQHPCNKGISCTFYFKVYTPDTTLYYNAVITTEDIQPAAAGGDIIAQAIVGLDVLGILIADTVTYEFGNYNGDDVFFQPSGDTLFPVDRLELIGSKVISSPFGSCGLANGDKNILYSFDPGSGCGAGSGNQVKIVYFYVSSLYNETAVFKPYAGMRSGSVIKYLSNYGSGVAVDSFVTTNSANKFTIRKYASCGICTPGDTIIYTVSIANAASYDVMFDKLLDSIPSGHYFVGIHDSSDITTTNSSVYPSAGDSFVLNFTGKIPEATFPYRSYLVPANDSIKLIYYARIPTSSSSTVYTSRVVGYISDYPIDTATVQTCAGCGTLPVTLLSFEAHQVGSEVIVSWEAVNEYNNRGYELYRLNDIGERELIGFIHGRNQEGIQYYSFVDGTNVKGRVTYILVQHDWSGDTEEYSCNLYIVGQEFVIWPNPGSEVIHISGALAIGQLDISIYDCLGNVVVSNSYKGTSQSHSLSIKDLVPGVYYIELKDERMYYPMKRFIKH